MSTIDGLGYLGAVPGKSAGFKGVATATNLLQVSGSPRTHAPYSEIQHQPFSSSQRCALRGCQLFGVAIPRQRPIDPRLRWHDGREGEGGVAGCLTHRIPEHIALPDAPNHLAIDCSISAGLAFWHVLLVTATAYLLTAYTQPPPVAGQASEDTVKNNLAVGAKGTREQARAWVCSIQQSSREGRMHLPGPHCRRCGHRQI